MNTLELQKKIDQLKLYIISKADKDGFIVGTNKSKYNPALMCRAAERVIYGDIQPRYLTRAFSIRATAIEIRDMFLQARAEELNIFKKGNIVKNNDRAILLSETSNIESTTFSGTLLWYDTSAGLSNEVGEHSKSWAKNTELIEGASAFELVTSMEFNTL